MEQMVAGPELDAEVARVVFGIDVLGIVACSWFEDGGGWYVEETGSERRPVYVANAWEAEDGRYPCGCLEAEERERVRFAAFCDGHGLEPPPPADPPVFGHDRHHLSAVAEYSTDIAAAWAVVERCTSLNEFAYRDVNGLPVATWFMGHFEASNLWAHSASEAAEKICLIALAAIEGRPVDGRAALAARTAQGGEG